MSVTATRRVSGSTNPGSRTQRYFGGGEAFVEHIDTANNITVRDENDRENESRNNNSNEQKFEETEENRTIAAGANYVPSAIEALAASGIYEVQEGYSENHKNIGVYDNNQAIVRDEEAESKGRSYLKHFYEKNEILEEVDKFV